VVSYFNNHLRVYPKYLSWAWEFHIILIEALLMPIQLFLMLLMSQR